MNNKEYWQIRLDTLVDSLLYAQSRNTSLFLKNYAQALIEIQAYSNLLYAKYSVDGVLPLAEMRKFDRYKDMEKQITSIIVKLGKEEELYMTKELTRIYGDSYVKTGALLTKASAKITTNFSLINTIAVNKAISYPWSGTNFSSRIWKNKEKLISTLSETLTRGYINGSSISTMTRDLKKVMDVSATNARRLIRTESMHIIGTSHHDAYTKAGITRVEFLTAKDDRVCDDCKALDGKIFPINEAPMIPQHANGRSVNLPVID